MAKTAVDIVNICVFWQTPESFKSIYTTYSKHYRISVDLSLFISHKHLVWFSSVYGIFISAISLESINIEIERTLNMNHYIANNAMKDWNGIASITDILLPATCRQGVGLWIYLSSYALSVCRRVIDSWWVYSSRTRFSRISSLASVAAQPFTLTQVVSFY